MVFNQLVLMYTLSQKTGRPSLAIFGRLPNADRFFKIPKRMHSPGINGEGELMGQPANSGSPGRMAIKMECVCFTIRLSSKHVMKQSLNIPPYLKRIATLLC